METARFACLNPMVVLDSVEPFHLAWRAWQVKQSNEDHLEVLYPP